MTLPDFSTFFCSGCFLLETGIKCLLGGREGRECHKSWSHDSGTLQVPLQPKCRLIAECPKCGHMTRRRGRCWNFQVWVISIVFRSVITLNGWPSSWSLGEDHLYSGKQQEVISLEVELFVTVWVVQPEEQSL